MDNVGIRFLVSDAFIRYLLEHYYDIQEVRKSLFNQLTAFIKSNADIYREFLGFDIQQYTKTYAKVAKMLVRGKIGISEEDQALKDAIWFYNRAWETEKGLKRRLERWSLEEKIRVEYLDKIQGIGPILSSGIIAWMKKVVLDPKTNTVSKFWAYLGLSAIHWQSECAAEHRMITTSKVDSCPVEIKKKGGKKEEREPCGAEILKSKLVKTPPKRKIGYVLRINFKLLSFCWKIAKSFEYQSASKSQYRRKYDEVKEKYLRRPDLLEPIEKGIKGSKLRVQLMSFRVTVKKFTADLWHVWRKMEGLPVTKPYNVEYLGHPWIEPKTDEELNKQKVVIDEEAEEQEVPMSEEETDEQDS